MEGCKRIVVMQRLEGLALALVCVTSYGTLGESWALFAALILVPDISMLGYVAGPRIGDSLTISRIIGCWLFSGWELPGYWMAEASRCPCH